MAELAWNEMVSERRGRKRRWRWRRRRRSRRRRRRREEKRKRVSPSKPSPQDHTLPSLVTTTQWLLPHARCTAGESRPATVRALRLGGEGAEGQNGKTVV